MKTQNLSKFIVPEGFRGRSAIFCQVWWLVQGSLFKLSPQFMYGWRNFILRMFGAKIGKGVKFRPSVDITYPWKLKVGNYSWVGDGVSLYTLGNIVIGENSVISQKCYLCSGSHDYNSDNFDIFSKNIFIGNHVWLATDVFVAPGISVEDNVVVGARSSVFSDLKGNSIYVGSPARYLKDRI
ncbi:putative colanic acid biosynthesis acetyltransferase [Marinobacterium lacunae]|uniref:putative colanic acid biosynthesis acetyltransferase n=1 Tax=Marinobacterium lacunae TaxID=1232683 RepID=UPI0009E09B1B|nr:putative colanic acid biosynthesis acetyltransferase [Marinobacterium lacunae]